ncbi:MAG: hypothetical protein ACYSR0_05890 [Planctomycetota bacterium]
MKNVRGWGKFIKTVKGSVPVQGANIVLRANPAKQRVGGKAGEVRRNLVRN